MEGRLLKITGLSKISIVDVIGRRAQIIGYNGARYDGGQRKLSAVVATIVATNAETGTITLRRDDGDELVIDINHSGLTIADLIPDSDEDTLSALAGFIGRLRRRAAGRRDNNKSYTTLNQVTSAINGVLSSRKRLGAVPAWVDDLQLAALAKLEEIKRSL